MFQPQKRVPATVEFADMAAGQTGAKSLVDVVAYRNADALLHVVRAFRDASVPHPQETISPLRDARTIEDELLLADLGVAERRLERLEKDLKKNALPDLVKEQAVLVRCKAALESGKALRTLGLEGDDARRLRGFQFLSAKPLLVVVNLDEADVSKTEEAASAFGLTEWLAETHDGGGRRVRQDRARDFTARRGRRRRLHERPRAPRVGARSRHSRGVRPAGLHLVFHRRRGRMPRVVDSA